MCILLRGVTLESKECDGLYFHCDDSFTLSGSPTSNRPESAQVQHNASECDRVTLNAAGPLLYELHRLY